VLLPLRAAHSGTTGLGTALQVRRSQVLFLLVSLKFFIDIIVLAALWPGSKGSPCVGLTTLHLHVPIVLKSGSLNLLEPSGTVIGQCRVCFIATYISLGIK